MVHGDPCHVQYFTVGRLRNVDHFQPIRHDPPHNIPRQLTKKFVDATLETVVTGRKLQLCVSPLDLNVTMAFLLLARGLGGTKWDTLT